MLYDRYKEVIQKLKDNAQGKYNRFSQSDIEYIICTIYKCAEIEDNE